jgi:hypothetical protein
MLAEIILKIAGQFQEKEETAYYPRPSMAGKERCTRQMVYHGLNYPHDPLAGRAVMIFSDSSFHEDLTADWIRKSAYQLHSEQMEITVDMGFAFKLKGHIDGIVTDLLNTDYLWEHKAINHFSWQKYWDGAIPYDYVSQCCIYLRGLHADNPNINKAILLLKNKNTAAYMEFIIFYNYDQDVAVIETATNSNGETKEINETIPDAVKTCFEKFAYVNDCIKNKTLPKRDYFIGDDWHCQYCLWGNVCYKDYKKEFVELKTDTDLPNEIADMLRFKKEISGHRIDMEKQEDELKNNIIAVMETAGVREGRAGEFIAKLKLLDVERLDKSLLTENERIKATTKSIQKRLYISTIKTS